MGLNVTQKLISSHLVAGVMAPDEEIGILIDQNMTWMLFQGGDQSYMPQSSSSLIRIAERLRKDISPLHFGPPVYHVYNPLTYGWRRTANTEALWEGPVRQGDADHHCQPGALKFNQLGYEPFAYRVRRWPINNHKKVQRRYSGAAHLPPPNRVDRQPKASPRSIAAQHAERALLRQELMPLPLS